MAISHLYPVERPTLSLNFARSKVIDSRVSITRTTTATFLGSNGLIQTAAANEGRIDHDPETGECLGLLMEQSRTNLILNSVINSSNWAVNGATLSNNTTETTAPDGTNTAAKYVPNSGNTGWCSIYNQSTISVTSGTAYTFSVWAKPTHSDYTVFNVRGDVRDAGGTNFNVLFTLSGDGSFDIDGHAEHGNADSASIEKYPNGWYRCMVTQTADATTTEEPAFAAGANGDGTKGFYAWGYQVEAGAFVTSYIPTTGSTETRNGDDAEISSTIFPDVIDPNQGTFLATAKTIEQHTNKMILNMRTTNTSNSFRINVLNDDVSLTVTRNYSQQAYLNQADAASAGINNVAAAYQSDDFAFTANGNTTSTDTSGDPPEQNGSNGALRLQIGSQHTGSNQLNGHVMRIAYYNTRLPNSALEALTK